jgi:CCR4-NOT transcription complex subunit 6
MVDRKLKTIRKLLTESRSYNPFSFSVASYNILADSIVDMGMYHYVDPIYMDKQYRMKLVLNDLKTLSSDIVCLQECEQSVFDFLKSNLSTPPIDGLFLRKSGLMVDGVATLWNSSKFTKLSSTSIDLNNSFSNFKDR